MKESRQSNGPDLQEPSAAERLDSWKEIAAYLKREVRTVRRWEKNEGLPVRRHMHGSQASVYAYKPELDAWWNNRRPRLESQEQTHRRTRVWWVAAALVVLTAGSFAAWWWNRQPVLPFEERDWVLIADFENRTGEPQFDGTLEYALERNLSNSRFVNVVSRWRVADTLLLMSKLQAVPLDEALAREVALRDGSIRAVVAGRVEKLGSRLLFSARLINPADGVTVASFAEEVAGPDEAHTAMRRLADRTRAALGEQLPQMTADGQPLERVTTPSLRALQLFSQGSVLKEQMRDVEAAPLFREAIKEDSEFAMAHTFLAWSMMRLGHPREEYVAFAKRGVELSAGATERERLFIQSSYEIFDERFEGAYSNLKALLQLYPDDYWAALSMTWPTGHMGLEEQLRQYQIKAADLRPHHFTANYIVASGLLADDKPEQARPYVERVLQLAEAQVRSQPETSAGWLASAVIYYSVFREWQRGDIDKAHELLQREAAMLNQRPEPLQEELAYRLSLFHVQFGQRSAAKSLCKRLIDPEEQRRCAQSVDSDARDREARRQNLLRRKNPAPDLALVLASAGLIAEAKAMLPKLEKLRMVPGWKETTRGLIALHEGRPGAVSELEQALEKLRPSNFPVSLLGTEALAVYFERKGDFTNAIRVLQEWEEAFSRDRRQALHSGASWLSAHERLLELHRKAGNSEDAQRIEGELRKRLKYADADHPILLRLNSAGQITKR